MANIEIKSYNEILGDLVRQILANATINDINPGSVLMTILEAAASNDFENNTAILNVLELLNIDAVKNNDLESMASNFGLQRNAAIKASGFVTVSDSAITKRSSGLYPVKPAPIKGTNTIYVNNASNWSPTGQIFIGRGTQNFEGPIAYTSINDFGTFYKINLSSSLQNDHLISEEVVDAQGTNDRAIAAGTLVVIPANNISPEIQYTTLRNAVIPAGEDKVEGVSIVAVKAGSSGNAGLNTITQFTSLPFPSAAITNTNSFNNGRDVETDDELRDRIKAYANTLARGTKSAILTAIQGISDVEEGKQVASAVITEPVNANEPSIIYLDDGSGFEPSYSGQSVDPLVSNANGNEEFFQLTNFPIPRPQIVNKAEGPYQLVDGMTLKIRVDGIEESITFSSSQFISISAAKPSETIIAINDLAQTFKCRLTENSTRLLVYPVAFDAETIEIVSDGSLLDANMILKFPTNKFSYISLYNGSKLLSEKEKSATIESNVYSSWNITGSGNLVLAIDGTPTQDRTFDASDFGGASFASLSLEDWIPVMNAKFAGITASFTSANKMIIKSNKSGATSSIEVVGGTYASKLFNTDNLLSVGQDSEFLLNRQNGNLQVFDVNPGDIISAGSTDTKGSIVSLNTNSGTYNLATDSSSRKAEVVIVVDASKVLPRSISLPIGTTLTVSDQGNNRMRILSSVSASFRDMQPLDYIYITNRGDIDGSGTGPWFDIKDCGLYQVVSKGGHLLAGVDTWIEVINNNIVSGGPYSILDIADFQGFYSDAAPQIWRPYASTKIATVASTKIKEVVDSIIYELRGVKASIYRTNSVRVTSSTEEGGSISVPVSVGNAVTLFTTAQASVEGNQSHIANKRPDKDIVTTFEITDPQSTYLDRYTYNDINGAITADHEPTSNYQVGYSEIIQDNVNNIANIASYNNSVNVLTGNNKHQIRAIQEIDTGTQSLKTRHESPRTIMDYNSQGDADKYQLIKAAELSPDDNIVIILDDDAIAKTVDVKFSRTGRVNSGSNGLGTGTGFTPNGVNFSASDYENESTVDFGTVNVWGTLSTQTNTNFNDYAVWFRARNWYISGGFTGPSIEPSMLVRATQYGPSGAKVKFQIKHPTQPQRDNTISHVNDPEKTVVTYTFGSDAARSLNIIAADTVTITSLGGGFFRYTFNNVVNDLSQVVVDDVLSILPISGVSVSNSGQFSITNVNIASRYVDVYNPNGIAATETISIPTSLFIFPLLKTSVDDIVEKINTSTVINAVKLNTGDIKKATIEEAVSGSNFAYGFTAHNEYIELYDANDWIASFQNINFNFALKNGLILPSAAPHSSIYQMDTVANPDPDSAVQGELFKLIPVTITNIKHHISHKALSQLDIVSELDYSKNNRKVQIKSEKLGSNGAIEIVGGRANNVAMSIIGDSQISAMNAVDYLEIRIPAYPETLNVGDSVVLANKNVATRMDRLLDTDTFDVVKINDETYEYRYNAKITNFNEFVRFTVASVPSTNGMVWRWQHSDAGGYVTLQDLNNGAAAFQARKWSATGVQDASTAIKLDLIAAGSPTTKQRFSMIIGSISGAEIPVQADYITFENNVGVTFAINFEVDGNVTAPTGATYLAATNKIACPILSTDTPNDIVGKIALVLNSFTIQTYFSMTVNAGATLQNIKAGDLLSVIGTTFGAGNQRNSTGDEKVCGLPIINVNEISRYFDVANPDGTAVAVPTAIDTDTLTINPTPVIKFNLNHDTTTRYKIESLGYNNTFRLTYVDGTIPYFKSCGVAVDDVLLISGTTFDSANSGKFRVLALDDTSIIFQNSNGKEQIHTIVDIGSVNWTASSNIVTGSSGAFANIDYGYWIKKFNDTDDKYRQVVARNGTSFADATQITLGSAYVGNTATTAGVGFDQTNGVNKGLYLKNIEDVTVFEGDSVQLGDSISISNIIDPEWFTINNTGIFEVSEWGTESANSKPFIRVINPAGSAQSGIKMTVNNGIVNIIEGEDNKFSTIRKIAHIAIDDTNPDRRTVYLRPGNRVYKWNQTNGTTISGLGKLGFNTDIVTGIDGYLYYTGLLRTVQRIVDGFEPNESAYSGRKAVGSIIELLPPLTRRIVVVINVTTKNGVNLSEITDEIKSSVINHIIGLKVGEDVVLSDIIVKIKAITGVDAVTFVTPTPDTERISVADNERAYIVPNDVSIA